MLKKLVTCSGICICILANPFVNSTLASDSNGIVEIEITKGGRDAKFVRSGDSEPSPVEVSVGQVVRWTNTDEEEHTARAMVKGKELFDTRYIKQGDSKDILFDANLYRKAGGDGNKTINIVYECQVHSGTMKGNILLKPKTAGQPEPSPSPQQNERVIEALTQGTNYLWKPSILNNVAVGDTIAWKIGSSESSGYHNLRIVNWGVVKDYFEVIDGLSFDSATGTTAGNDKSNTTLLRLRVKLALTTPIRFFCPTHGEDAMAGMLTSQASSDTIPAALDTASEIIPVFLTETKPIAAFDVLKVTDRKKDSYYAIAADLNADGRADIVTSGLGVPGQELAEVAWYENPSWRKKVIGNFDVPVALDAEDIDGDGFEDIVITDDYGECIFNCKPGSGLVAWLQNPGYVSFDKDWKRFNIGRHLASHRVKIGHFTAPDQLQLLSVPVVGGAEGRIHDPIEVRVYSRPRNVLSASEWPWAVADDSLSIIHEVCSKNFGKKAKSPLESVLVASDEGINWLRYQGEGKWSLFSIGPGERTQIGRSAARWKGSGSVDAGRWQADDDAFVVTTEPFHGNKLALYTKDNYSDDTASVLDSTKWIRTVVDTVGPLSNRGEGPGHHVQTIDVDGDGNDEILVGLRGPHPNSGVHIYCVESLSPPKVVRQQISAYSAAEIICADFDGDGRQDFATIPYRVPSYIIADTTEVMVYLNRTPKKTK